jgi:hypothetical protein
MSSIYPHVHPHAHVKKVLRPGHSVGRKLDASGLCDVLRGALICKDFTAVTSVVELLLWLDPELVAGTQLADGIDGNGHHHYHHHHHNNNNHESSRNSSSGSSSDSHDHDQQAQFQVRLLRAKCRFTRPTSGGWADLLVNFTFPDDPHAHVMELQVQHDTLVRVRKQGNAHARYGSFRAAAELLQAAADQQRGEGEAEPPAQLKILRDVTVGVHDDSHNDETSSSYRRPVPLHREVEVLREQLGDANERARRLEARVEQLERLVGRLLGGHGGGGDAGGGGGDGGVGVGVGGGDRGGGGGGRDLDGDDGEGKCGGTRRELSHGEQD